MKTLILKKGVLPVTLTNISLLGTLYILTLEKYLTKTMWNVFITATF